MRAEGHFQAWIFHEIFNFSRVEIPIWLCISHMGVSGERISPDFALCTPRPPCLLPSLAASLTFAEYVGGLFEKVSPLLVSLRWPRCNGLKETSRPYAPKHTTTAPHDIRKRPFDGYNVTREPLAPAACVIFEPQSAVVAFMYGC
jgi:hypothetical protein